MNLSKNSKKILVIVAVVLIVGVGGTIIAINLLNSDTDPPEPPIDYLYPDMMGNESEYAVKVTYINHAGIMLETEDLRIYVDPYQLDETYSEKPADIVFITHHHNDHYDTNSLNKILTDETEIVTPATCTGVISNHGATGVAPGDNGTIGSCYYEAFYMYNKENFNHPKSANWCSFIIEIEDITFFHAGDSEDIDEYAELTDRIDVAFLPIGGSTYTMDVDMAIDAVGVIQPKIVMPIHYGSLDLASFLENCEEPNPDTDVLEGPVFYLA